MNRLATVEAYRMCAVVDQALEQLDLLSRMPANDLSGLSGLDPALELQQAQEHRYLSLYREARRMGATDGKDLSLAGINVRSSTRELVRALKTKLDLRASIMQYCADPSQPGPSPGVAHLSSTLDKLKQLVEKKLCTTVEQQESRNGFAAELATHARELEKDIEELESQLKEERVKTETDLTYQSEIISKLTRSHRHQAKDRATRKKVGEGNELGARTEFGGARDQSGSMRKRLASSPRSMRRSRPIKPPKRRMPERRRRRRR